MLPCERAVLRATVFAIGPKSLPIRVPRQLSPRWRKSLSRPPAWTAESGRRMFSAGAVGRQDQLTKPLLKSDENIPPPTTSSFNQSTAHPLTCPGCGALSQTVDANAAGYYSPTATSKSTRRNAATADEDAIFQEALRTNPIFSVDSTEEIAPSPPPSTQTPICARCHNLIYQSKGESIIHPSILSIQQIIQESPHRHNHIYHVLDAADFPMSLIPNLQHSLELPRMRTRNRRSKHVQYSRGRVAEVSFIITRSDLLAPKKEQVDTMLPYLREVLRDALGRSDKTVRLGNVRCVSAFRGWWTPNVKEDIWERGGGGWMVGKVNVGKSKLFEVVFPRNRSVQELDVKRLRQDITTFGGEADAPLNERDSLGEICEPSPTKPLPEKSENHQESEHHLSDDQFQESVDDFLLDEDADTSLLPPAQPETAFPNMPIVSSLPGTTASPIRIPFGSGKGELIDLPGVHRSDLADHIALEHRRGLILKSRPTPSQQIIKPGQSLLLGGVIRLTPRTASEVMIAHTFLPTALTPHVTSTSKAIAIQTGVHPQTATNDPFEPSEIAGTPYSGTVPTVATAQARTIIAPRKPDPTVTLAWDVTKRRTGPLTDPTAGKQKSASLPFRVWGADVLIEGCGWVELSCQVRNRGYRQNDDGPWSRRDDDERAPTGPEVEVWSPEGKFVGVRKPMNAWVLNDPKRKAKANGPRGRGRQTISMSKRKEGGRRGGAVSNT